MKKYRVYVRYKSPKVRLGMSNFVVEAENIFDAACEAEGVVDEIFARKPKVTTRETLKIVKI